MWTQPSEDKHGGAWGENKIQVIITEGAAFNWQHPGLHPHYIQPKKKMKKLAQGNAARCGERRALGGESEQRERPSPLLLSSPAPTDPHCTSCARTHTHI
ncbi:unnamed protein product [Pleuronectes platessa]|uniref:Uncharacterized protein n=1 Tax=Pleuronectes platessa TaxID=8262 RepID=A0A9N7TUP4_PLEPL|nr:unnamed protein product [Pleuronectes platessa]